MMNSPAQQQVVNPGFALSEIAGFAFALAAFRAIDRTGYEAGDEKREIVLYLADGVEHVFEGTRADLAEHWYLTLTGQARVTPAPGLAVK